MISVYNADKGTERLIKKVYKAALKRFSQPDIFEVEAEIVTADEIREINRENRNTDAVTDVLSFPCLETGRVFPIKKEMFITDVNPDSGKLMLGEIIMCTERISEQAAEYGHTYERECGYLFLHGLLHLLGYDHENQEEQADMRREEETILQGLGIKRG